MKVVRFVLFILLMHGKCCYSVILPDPNDLGQEKVLKFIKLNDKHDTSKYVKLESQIKDNKDEVGKFTLCFRFLLNSLSPSSIFASNELEFTIESPSKILGKLKLNKNEPMKFYFDAIKIIPLKWNGLCVIRDIKLKEHNVSIFFNGDLIFAEKKDIFSYKLPTKSNFMENATVGRLILGMATHVMCSSEIVEDAIKKDFFYTKDVADKFDIFDWRKVEVDQYASDFVQIHLIDKKEMKLMNNFYLSENGMTKFFEACRSCSFLRGALHKISRTPGTYFWSSYTKINNTCTNRTIWNTTVEDNWELSEPNGFHNQECIAYNSETGLYKDDYCYFEYRSICRFEPHASFTLRGVPAHIKEIENHFFSTIYNGELIFVGYKRNIIRKNGEIWEIQSELKKAKLLAFYNGSKILPHGVNQWHYSQNNHHYAIPLMFTKCNTNQYTCNDSSCIPVERVCDDLPDCTDGEDESDCKSVVAHSYQRDFPPPLNKNRIRTPINVKFYLKAINNVEELENMLEIDFRIDLAWRDSRLLYYRLNSTTFRKSRALTKAEKNEIWIPPLIFESTVDQYDSSILRRNGHASILKDKNVTGRLNSFRELWRRIEYGGLDAQVIFEAHFKMRIYCHFHFKSYPFDTQKCTVVMSLPFDLEEKVHFVGYFTDHMPIELLQYEMTTLKLLNRGQRIIAQITLRRIFYNIFWTTYLPTFCLQIVVLLTLFFPPTRFETTIMITLTTTLVIYTLYQSVSNSLPTTAYNKMIDYWLFFSLIMPFFVFVIEVGIEIYELKGKSRTKILNSTLVRQGRNLVIVFTLSYDIVYWIYNLFFYY